MNTSPSAFTETQAELESGTPAPTPAPAPAPAPEKPTPDTAPEKPAQPGTPAAPAGTAASDKSPAPAPLVPMTPIVPQVLKQNNYMPAANDLNIAFASDLANGNTIPCTGQEVLWIFNNDTVLHHFTITSAPDQLGRTGDIAAYVVNPGTLCAIQMSQVVGWKQSDGTIHISSDNALLKFAVVLKH